MTKARVLIVNDDVGIACYLSSYLVRHNFDVNTVGSGEDAIRVFRVYDPALVLMDIAMGGMKGWVDDMKK